MNIFVTTTAAAMEIARVAILPLLAVILLGIGVTLCFYTCRKKGGNSVDLTIKEEGEEEEEAEYDGYIRFERDSSKEVHDNVTDYIQVVNRKFPVFVWAATEFSTFDSTSNTTSCRYHQDQVYKFFCNIADGLEESNWRLSTWECLLSTCEYLRLDIVEALKGSILTMMITLRRLYCLLTGTVVKGSESMKKAAHDTAKEKEDVSVPDPLPLSPTDNVSIAPMLMAFATVATPDDSYHSPPPKNSTLLLFHNPVTASPVKLSLLDKVAVTAANILVTFAADTTAAPATTTFAAGRPSSWTTTSSTSTSINGDDDENERTTHSAFIIPKKLFSEEVAMMAAADDDDERTSAKILLFSEDNGTPSDLCNSNNDNISNTTPTAKKRKDDDDETQTELNINCVTHTSYHQEEDNDQEEGRTEGEGGTTKIISYNSQLTVDSSDDDEESLWNEMYKRLSQMYKDKGHSVVTRSDPDQFLYQWTCKQNEMRPEGRLPEWKVKKLNVIKFCWNEVDQKWDAACKELMVHLKQNANSGPPAHLLSWVRDQRERYNDKTIPREHEIKLQEIDPLFFIRSIVIPPISSASNTDMDFAAATIPAAASNQYGGLLMSLRDGNINNSEVEQLQQQQEAEAAAAALQLQRSNNTDDWEFMFRKLVAYKVKHKDTMVPRRYEEDKELGWWVNKQRICYKRGILLKPRRRKMKSIGFVWYVDADDDENKYNRNESGIYL